MNYYSLHHKSPNTSFKNAVIQGLAKDRGIYFPENITPLSKDFIANITGIQIMKLRMKQLNSLLVMKFRLKN